jgi:hypothetical protein
LNLLQTLSYLPALANSQSGVGRFGSFPAQIVAPGYFGVLVAKQGAGMVFPKRFQGGLGRALS